MTTDVVWVSPSARVKTAVILMKGHDIGALPVLHDTEGVVGLVTLADLVGEPPEAVIEDLMQADFVSVPPDTTVQDAAEIMSESRVSHLLVMERGNLLGVVTWSDLMPELGRSYDPLTELPWSDSFREWAMNALKNGLEISVILFDLDGFGKFNKRHGHVIGDRVLKAAANVLGSGIDAAMEMVCRYGGDEFAIVSTRNADDAEALAKRLQERIAALNIEGMPEKVTTSWGMFGGRRTKEREDMHYAATLDDLITRASKNCIKAKPWPEMPEEAPVPAEARAGQPAGPEMEAAVSSQAADADVMPPPVKEHRTHRANEPEIERAPRFKIESISFTSTGSEASAGVVLKRAGRNYQREASGYAVGGDSILRLFAEAAAGAVCKALAPEHGIVVEDASIRDSGRDDEIVTVVAIYVSPRQSARLVGSALVRRGDQYRAAVAALLDAVNRQIETAPPAEEDEPEGI